MDAAQIELFSHNCALFKDYIQSHIFDAVSPEKNIFRLYGVTEKYIRFEEINSNNDVLGIIMDITSEYTRQRQLEIDCEIDPLTGLLNRRGLNSRLTALFGRPDKLGCGALVMLDADGLKQINDRFGHAAGDIYLKSIAEILTSFNSKNCICARHGGDEFILFLYNFENKSQVDAALKRLSDIRSERTAEVAPPHAVPVNFSFGTAFLTNNSNPDTLIKIADKKMYEKKRQRKQKKN